ncbi:MAG TPA: dephospho-CoA kinase [Candidatus Baltobacteraceae bacterium]|jgi:dephospho-CoA kinase|nr:dephospho-CoA kinase [Candidatus Baltobacteraceae bacterium]
MALFVYGRSDLRAGLTGGIGAGKSEVARILESLGAYIIDTDKLAREAVAPGSDGLREIARAWPRVVRDGCLDRSALAEIVFHDPTARERLNAIVHPHVRRLADEHERYAAPGQLIVHVVPLLFETGYDSRVDASILVIAPEAARIERVVRRDRLSEEQVRSRIKAQIDPEAARRKATYCIENDGDISHLKERTRAVYEALTQKSHV